MKRLMILVPTIAALLVPAGPAQAKPKQLPYVCSRCPSVDEIPFTISFRLATVQQVANTIEVLRQRLSEANQIIALTLTLEGEVTFRVQDGRGGAEVVNSTGFRVNDGSSHRIVAWANGGSIGLTIDRTRTWSVPSQVVPVGGTWYVGGEADTCDQWDACLVGSLTNLRIRERAH